MSLVVRTSALKGAAYRRVGEAVRERLEGCEDQLTPEQRECLDALVSAANKLISRSPAGMQLDVHLELSAGPFGALSMTAAVTASRPRTL